MDGDLAAQQSGAGGALTAGRLFAGGSEMAALMRGIDWAATPIGPIERWPQSLRTALSICLASRFPMAIWWGPEGTQLYNDAYWPILGGKHPQSMGQAAAECWAEIWDVVGPLYNQVRASGEPTWSEDLRLDMARYGYVEETYFTFSYSTIPDEGGDIGGILVTCVETTERVLSERRLRTLRELAAGTVAQSAAEACAAAASILGNNPADVPIALIYLLDASRTEARLAGAAGIEAGDPAAPAVVDLGEPMAGDGWRLAAVARTGAATEVADLANRAGDLPTGIWPESPRSAMVLPLALPGHDRPTAILVAAASPRRPLDDAYRSFFELVAGQVTTTIAEALAYEDERRRAEALAELDRAKTAFFSDVSHEFRTPLTLMLGPLGDLLERSNGMSPEETRAEIEVAQRNGLRLLRLVNTLLDFSRIEAGRIEASYEPTNLAALTADLASVFRSAIERAGLTLTVDCPPLPEPVYVDREMWEKIVLNLLSNAFKFTLEGEIAVSLRWSGAAAELMVQDTGAGIPAEERAQIFDRFHRVRGARARSHEGSGIGLSLVRELVLLHGGTIGVESVVGEGTAFTVRVPAGVGHLPADRIEAERTLVSTAAGAAPYVEEAVRWLLEEGRADLDQPFPAEASPTPSAGFASTVGARVLVADDNADMRRYLQRLLGGPWTVEAVADGAAALAAAMEHRPDLVLADVMMPGLDGFELLRSLRGDPRTQAVPVILLSARAGEEARVEGLAAGADDYLVKPFSARELVARVGAHLELARVRGEAERARGESEEQYRTLFNSIDEGYCVCELIVDEQGRPADYRFLDVNPLFGEMTGIPPDAVGRTARELVPGLEDWWVETYGRVVLTSEPARFEQGSEVMGRIFDVYVAPVGSKAGGRFAIVFTDITARKRAETVLREGEARQAFLLKLSDTLRAETGVEAVGNRAVQMIAERLGVDRAYLVTLTPGDDTIVVTHEARRADMPPLRGSYRGSDFPAAIKEIFERTIVYNDVRTDTRLTDLDRMSFAGLGAVGFIAAPIRRGSEAMIWAAGALSTQPRSWTAIEVALFEDAVERTWASVERARAEEALRASEERLERIVENIAEGVVTIGADGRFLSINAAGEQILGVERERFLGRDNADPPYRRLTLQREPLSEVPTIAEVAASGDTVFRHEYLIERADGTRIALARSITAVRAENGDFLGAVATFIDVTARRRMEEARDRLLAAEREARREAEAANRAKDEFLSVLSHELRTPLTPILGFSQMLKQDKLPADRLRLAIETIDRNARAQARLVEDLLDVSRILSNKLIVEMSYVDPAQVLETAVVSARPAAEAKGLTLTATLDPAAGPVLGDADRLQQVAANLLSNAIKFTPAGGRVDVTLARDGGEALITVTDTGSGIPADFLPQIFERFRQADSTTTRAYGGLGLGMAIAQHLVERHGGRIVAESAGPGQGATFRVWLPLMAQGSALTAPGEGAPRAVSPAARLRGLRVMVADDDADTRALVRVMLEDEGAAVLTAGSSAEALAVLQATPVDMLVADIGMPEEDGYGLMAKVRALSTEVGQIPALALTAYAGAEDRWKALDAGFQHHLPKPVDEEALVAAITDLAGSGRRD